MLPFDCSCFPQLVGLGEDIDEQHGQGNYQNVSICCQPKVVEPIHGGFGQDTRVNPGMAIVLCDKVL